MGFPVGYTDHLLPKLLLHSLTLLTFLRKLLTPLFSFLDTVSSSGGCGEDLYRSVSELLIREVLPVVKFSDVADPTSDNCAVCLVDFEGGDEVRRLTNCRHVFHRSCIDRWIGYDQAQCQRGTCPLCRTALIPDDLQESFNERLWAASGIHEYHYYCDNYDDSVGSFHDFR